MPFKIALSPTYKAQVSVEIPNAGGSNDKSTFSVIFNRYTVHELEGEDSKGGMKQLLQPEIMRLAVVDWAGISADDGTVFEYSPENLETMMKIPQVMKALSDTFWTTQYGAKQKN
jgi:hypothetical protein